MRFPNAVALSLACLLLCSVGGAGEASGAQPIRLGTPAERRQSAAQLREKSRGLLDQAYRKARVKGWRIRSRSGERPYALQFIRDGYPVYYGVCNYYGAVSTAADLVRMTTPYDLTGNGVRVGVWDEGGVLATHEEFTGRVTLPDGEPVSSHATHMAGTIASAGFNWRAIGMAPLVLVDSYGWEEEEAEMVSAAATASRQSDKVYLSNHSYAILAGWEFGIDLSGYEGPHWIGTKTEGECQYFGQYDSISVSWDEICHSARYFLPFKSAGTQRNDVPPAEGEVFYYFDLLLDDWTSKTFDSGSDPGGDGVIHGGFDTITDAGCAKNVVTVGAVADAVLNGKRSLEAADMAAFSGWGPTDDGRIKPDLVANGVGVYSTSAESDDSYSTRTGTSSAAANASGSAALLVEQFRNLFPALAMRASTLKALLIHTADDLGNAGPDYVFGWGLMNTRAAADHLRMYAQSPQSPYLVEGRLIETRKQEAFEVVWDGVHPIRVTLCWTDPAGEMRSLLNDPTPVLVNDLDLRVEAEGTSASLPYVLDRTHPSVPATQGVNGVDNVEQVLIATPVSEKTYTVVVECPGLQSAGGTQEYALLISGIRPTQKAFGTGIWAIH